MTRCFTRIGGTVVDGNLFFTSIAPGNYQFPYAPGLYVAAVPFASMVLRDSGDMTLLRILVIAFDSVAAALLDFAVVRTWADRRAGAIAVALYHLVPLDFNIASVVNFTNAFAQALAVFALVIVCAPALRFENRRSVAGLVLVLAAGVHVADQYLRHPLSRGRGDRARLHLEGRRIVAFACPRRAAWQRRRVRGGGGFMYGHFGETYRAELARISAETAQNAPDAGGRTLAARLAGVPWNVRVYIGLPVLLLASVGAWSLFQNGARDRLTLSLLGWGAACLAFLTLGVVTPVDMRYYLASIPALALAGAAGASWLWDRGGSSRWLAGVLLAYTALIGVRGVISF